MGSGLETRSRLGIESREFAHGRARQTTSSSKLTFVGLAYNSLFQPTPATPISRPQSLVEAFYRIQLTDSMQLTPDIQVVFDPSTRSDTDSVVVVGLRLTTDF